MNRTERLNAILNLLAEAGQVEVEDIVGRLAVSPATVRRDLDSLANERLRDPHPGRRHPGIRGLRPARTVQPG